MTEDIDSRALLTGWQAGDIADRDALIARLYPELSTIAAARLRRERGSSLSSADLVHEVVLRLIQVEKFEVKDRAHIMALASQIMRHFLIDRARSKLTDKRKHEKVELYTGIEGDPGVELFSLNSALMKLADIDSTLSQIVEMRFFGGMSNEEIGQVLGLSVATVKRRWQTARAWLIEALQHPVD